MEDGIASLVESTDFCEEMRVDHRGDESMLAESAALDKHGCWELVKASCWKRTSL